MREPVPYKTVAVASTFSPRFKQVLAEAKRIHEHFSADLHLIYVGEHNESIAKKFRDAFTRLKLPLDSKIHYEHGDAAEAILRAVTREKVDVIVAGALEKEVVLHPFLGNVARRLVREAPCSVMLFTEPAEKPKPLRRIVFVAESSDVRLDALKRTLRFAAKESCERLYVIRIITTFDQARASIRGKAMKRVEPPADKDDEEGLEKFVLSAGPTDVPIEARCIRGNTGLAASDFVQSVEADLLIVPVGKVAGRDQQLPGNIAWVTDVIPCNLWLIR